MDKRRVVAVQARDGVGPTRISSGYVIAPRLVLTAAHAVPSGARAAVQPLQSTELLPCDPVWDGRETGLDALLLLVPAHHWPSGLSDAPVRFGRLVTSLPDTRATAIGFAAAGRTASGLETTQVSGVVQPGDGLLGERWRLSLDGPDPQEPGPSPWRGMSGAALWAGQLLCGVIAEDAAHWGHRKLDAVPVHRLLRDKPFRAVLRELGGRMPVVEPVELAGLGQSPVPQRLPQSPAELLRPHVEAVPFLGRESWLRELRQWCEGGGVSVRLLLGPGGQGKTRLAREFAVRLAVDGWASCQFRDGGLGDAELSRELSALAAVDRPLLLVMDYADTRPGLVTEVLRVLEERQADTPVRVLLIARSRGEWWGQLPGAGPRSAGILGGARVLELREAAAGPRERQEFHRAALTAMAGRLATLPGHAGTDWIAAADAVAVEPERFADAGSGSALTLQMHALIDLLATRAAGAVGQPESTEAGPNDAEIDIEALLLSHEEGYWRRTAARRPALAGLETGVLADAVAVATLTRTRDAARAVELLALAPPLAQLGEHVLGALAEWLRDLYPDNDGSYWHALEPDRIGEYHVVQRIRDRAELLPALLAGLDEGEAERALTVLARAAAQPTLPAPDLAETVGALIQRHPAGLAVPAVTVAVRSENPGFLAAAITEVVHQVDLPADLMKRLREVIPERSRLFGAEGVQLATRLRTGRLRRLPWLGGWFGPVRTRSEWADAEYHLAVRLGAADQWPQALRASARAVTLYRALARRGSARFLPRQADALSFHSIALSQLGRSRDALAAAAGAVSAADRMVYQGKGESEEQRRLRLALALTDQSVVLAASGDDWAALRACEEATGLLRELARHRPVRYEVALGRVLHQLAGRYAVLAEYREAERAGALALQVRRRLALAQPDAHLRDLLDSLQNHAVDLVAVGRQARALELLDECLHLAVELALSGELAQRAPVARVLMARAAVLTELDRPDEAALCGARAVLFYRSLADSMPEQYEPELAQSLGKTVTLLLLAGTSLQRCRALWAETTQMRRRLEQRELRRTRWPRWRGKALQAVRWLLRQLARLPRLRLVARAHRPDGTVLLPRPPSWRLRYAASRLVGWRGHRRALPAWLRSAARAATAIRRRTRWWMQSLADRVPIRIARVPPDRLDLLRELVVARALQTLTTTDPAQELSVKRAVELALAQVRQELTDPSPVTVRRLQESFGQLRSNTGVLGSVGSHARHWAGAFRRLLPTGDTPKPLPGAAREQVVAQVQAALSPSEMVAELRMELSLAELYQRSAELSRAGAWQELLTPVHDQAATPPAVDTTTSDPAASDPVAGGEAPGVSDITDA